jgi:short-subunit dehydrogenase involved in D-alanine esterification of teichoic acids
MAGAFAEQGARVMICGRTQASLEETAANPNRIALPCQCDPTR